MDGKVSKNTAGIDVWLQLKSPYERMMAVLLGGVLGIKHEYEPTRFMLSDGQVYTPDIYLPELGVYMELKGGRRPERMSKPYQLATELYRQAPPLDDPAEDPMWWQEHLTVVVAWEDRLLHMNKGYGCVNDVTTVDGSRTQVWCSRVEWARCGACDRWQPYDPCNGWQCRGDGCRVRGKAVIAGGTMTHREAIAKVQMGDDRRMKWRKAKGQGTGHE